MSDFWQSVLYLAATGAASFFLGRIVPEALVRPDRFPYKSYRFEKNGDFYKKLNIQHWQNKVPDMSRILPFMMPAKKLGSDYRERLPEMIRETCVAELIHALLCVTGLYAIKLCPGWVGVTVYILYVVIFNLPFILIQRYNRPRLQRLEQKTKGRAKVCVP